MTIKVTSMYHHLLLDPHKDNEIKMKHGVYGTV